MRKSQRKGLKLPQVNNKSASYALHSINNAMKGCYDQHKRLVIDEGFGDYNMKLFRLKDRKRYLKTVPSAFTPDIHELLYYKANNPQEKRIVTQHNERISRILNEPKEVYIQQIKRQRRIQSQRKLQQRKKYQYIKGEDRQIRQHKEQLSFKYLPQYISQQWFKLVDRSEEYREPVPFNFSSSVVFSKKHNKSRKKKGHIFFSDNKSFRTTNDKISRQ